MVGCEQGKSRQASLVYGSNHGDQLRLRIGFVITD